MKIKIASPRGFCAGVERAILVVEKTLEKYGPPIYVRHEIVHNKAVIERLKQKGVIFVEEVKEVPDNGVVIFSAHGIAQRVYSEAQERGLLSIDATCPLVKKVHFSVAKYHKKKAKIILIGHRDHPEVIGTLGQLPEGEVILVENEEQVEALSLPVDEPIAYATQTTLSHFETQSIINALKKKFPHIMGPNQGDLCYATTNRQKAILQIAKRCDVILIIGSSNSSNSNRLRELSESQGIVSYLIEDYQKIKTDYLKEDDVVGISSGASAPEHLVEQVVDHLKKTYSVENIEEVQLVKEDVHFQLPLELRK